MMLLRLLHFLLFASAVICTNWSIPPPHLPQQWPPYDATMWAGLNQSLSSGAQTATIAFANFAWATGDLCADTFLPPGKVADIYGFQYVRDGTADGLGHNSGFANVVSAIVLNNLTSSQLDILKSLADAEVDLLNATVLSRQPFQYAMRRYLGDPTLQLDMTKVIEAMAHIYDLDANLTLLRGEYYGQVFRTLTQAQIDYWETFYDYNIWTFPNSQELIDNIHVILQGLDNSKSVEVQTFATDLFVQATQPLYADVYWAPERVSDFWGAFYLKDISVVGVANYTIDENATKDGGELFMDVAGADAKTMIKGITALETPYLYDWVTVRTIVATELRKYHTHNNINQSLVRDYMHLHGMYDGIISYYYAVNFTSITRALTSEQMATLQANRSPAWNVTICALQDGAFFFAEETLSTAYIGDPPLDLFISESSSSAGTPQTSYSSVYSTGVGDSSTSVGDSSNGAEDSSYGAGDSSLNHVNSTDRKSVV